MRFAASGYLSDLYRRVINAATTTSKRLLDLGAPNIIVRNWRSASLQASTP